MLNHKRLTNEALDEHHLCGFVELTGEIFDVKALVGECVLERFTRVDRHLHLPAVASC
jgi:hypothetical protein